MGSVFNHSKSGSNVYAYVVFSVYESNTRVNIGTENTNTGLTPSNTKELAYDRSALSMISFVCFHTASLYLSLCRLVV